LDRQLAIRSRKNHCPSQRPRKRTVDQAQTKVWDSVRNGTNSKAPVSAPRAQISADISKVPSPAMGALKRYEKNLRSRAVGVSIDDFVKRSAAPLLASHFRFEE